MTENKESFFDIEAPFAGTLNRFYGKSSPPLIKIIPKEIIDDVVGGMLFDSDAETMLKEKALSIFTRTRGSANQSSAEESSYVVTIAAPMQFDLAIRFMSRGSSFRAAARQVQDAKEVTGVAELGHISDTKCAEYARIIAAANLIMIPNVERLLRGVLLQYSLIWERPSLISVFFAGRKTTIASR